MRVRHQVNSVTWLEFDAANPKEMIKLLSEFGEVFVDKACGACHSEEIGYEHREVEGNNYYSLKCKSCGARLDFGQHRTGETLFAKRKDKDGNWLENRGWTKWQGGQDGGKSQQRQPARQSVQQSRGNGRNAPVQDEDIPFLWAAFIPFIGIAASSLLA